MELQNRDLLLSGKKAELIARLLEHDSPVIEEVVEEEDIEGDVVNDESE